MRKLNYILATVCSFIVSVGIATFWLDVGRMPFTPAPIGEAVIISKSVKLKSPQEVTDLLPVSTTSSQLPCSRDGADSSKPWVRMGEVLSSFPPDSRPPKFIGTFRDKNWNFQLDLYRDTKGIFGEISSPVKEADSDTSRLYNVSYDLVKGALQFEAQVPTPFGMNFTGLLLPNVIKGKIRDTQKVTTKIVTLKRLKKSDEDAVEWNSRAQFDCAMLLWRRY